MLTKWEKFGIIGSVTKLLSYFGAYFYYLRYKQKENQYLADCIISEVRNSGNLFWKLSQWICARAEFMYQLDDNYLINQLKHFYDKCPHHDFEETRRIIEHNYKKKLEEVFESFHKTPVASGSIGQVHIGKLKNGKKVAVKVRHPKIADNIQFMCDGINSVKNFIYSHNSIKNNYLGFDLEGLDKYLLEQTDFTKEASHLKTAQNLFKKINIVKVPTPYYCSEDLLVMEYIDGKNIDEYRNTHNEKDFKEIMYKFWLLIREGITIKNFCHADLHKGNWKISGDKIVIYDFGIVLNDRRFFEDYRNIWEGFETRDFKLLGKTISRNAIINGSPILANEIEFYMKKNCDNNTGDISKDVKILLDFMNEKNIVINFGIVTYLLAFNLAVANFKNFTFVEGNKSFCENFLDRNALLKDRSRKYSMQKLTQDFERVEKKFMELHKNDIKKMIELKDKQLEAIDDVLNQISDEEESSEPEE